MHIRFVFIYKFIKRFITPLYDLYFRQTSQQFIYNKNSHSLLQVAVLLGRGDWIRTSDNTPPRRVL